MRSDWKSSTVKYDHCRMSSLCRPGRWAVELVGSGSPMVSSWSWYAFSTGRWDMVMYVMPFARSASYSCRSMAPLTAEVHSSRTGGF